MPAPSYNRKAVLAYLRKLAHPYRRNMVWTACLILTGTIAFMTPPLMTKYILEQVLPQQDLGLLVIVCLCTVIVPIIGSAVILVETYLMRFALYIGGQGRADLFNGIQHQSLSWMQRQRSGDLITRTLDDSEEIIAFVDNKIWWMLWLIITITIGSIVLLTLHTGLALLILGLWAAHAVLVSLLGRRVKQRAAESARQASHVTETIREVLTAAPFIKASGQERLALETVDSVLHNDWNVTRKGIQTNHLVEFFNTWLGSCFLVVLYWVGGHSVADKQMTIGALIAFLAVYNWLQPFGIALFETYFASKKVAPAVERIAEVAFSVPAKSGIIPSIRSMDIEAEDLSFKHDGNSILEKVSFHIAAGSVVSVIGSRGSGKSSLTELLLGLRQPSSGTVSIGGVPLDQIDEGWLRSQLLGITQEVMLRNGTILDNILYGSDNADTDAVQQAIRHAELTDWIAQLPDGLLTQVGEQGLILSGGERQRISIARALLRKPSILILDEATSALDMRTEQRLLTHLTEQLKGTTLIFITHRMAVTRLSDQILQLQDGRIMARSA